MCILKLTLDFWCLSLVIPFEIYKLIEKVFMRFKTNRTSGSDIQIESGNSHIINIVTQKDKTEESFSGHHTICKQWKRNSFIILGFNGAIH